MHTFHAMSQAVVVHAAMTEQRAKAVEDALRREIIDQLALLVLYERMLHGPGFEALLQVRVAETDPFCL